MQRAGHHAIINWLTGHYKKSILRNDFDHEDRIEEYYGDGPSNCTFSNVEDHSIEKSLEIINQDCESTTTVLVVRDPYNLFASRMSAQFTVRLGAITEEAKNVWLDHAQEYLNGKKIDICISYNQWFLDRDYRHEITRILGLDYNENKLNEVPEFGYGSSFDSLDYNGRAYDMKVMERWKEYIDNNDFNNFIKDNRLIGLSDRMFGPVLGF